MKKINFTSLFLNIMSLSIMFAIFREYFPMVFPLLFISIMFGILVSIIILVSNTSSKVITYILFVISLLSFLFTLYIPAWSYFREKSVDQMFERSGVEWRDKNCIFQGNELKNNQQVEIYKCNDGWTKIYKNDDIQEEYREIN